MERCVILYHTFTITHYLGAVKLKNQTEITKPQVLLTHFILSKFYKYCKKS